MDIEMQVKDIVTKLVSDWSSLMSAELLSETYNASAESFAEGVYALSALHPRWSEEETTILSYTKDSAHLLNEEDPLFQSWEQVEDLFDAWQGMQSSKLTLNSVMNTVPSIWGPLYALSHDFVSRSVRNKLMG